MGFLTKDGKPNTDKLYYKFEKGHLGGAVHKKRRPVDLDSSATPRTCNAHGSLTGKRLTRNGRRA
jgi:hypothetical protein